MATLPGAQITIGDIVDDAYSLLKSVCNNIDSYTGNATDTNFNARNQKIENQTAAE